MATFFTQEDGKSARELGIGVFRPFGQGICGQVRGVVAAAGGDVRARCADA